MQHALSLQGRAAATAIRTRTAAHDGRRGRSGLLDQPEPSAPPGPRPRILIADASAVLASLLQTTIAGAGYDAQAAGTAEEAMRLLRASPPELVVLDSALTAHDGRSLLRVIRAEPLGAKVPVIVLTDRADRASVLAAIGMRVSAYILKPQFKAELLLNHIRQILEQPSTGVQRRHDRGAAANPPSPGDAPDEARDAQPPATSLRDLRPILSRSELEERLRGCDQLRAFSPSVNRVLALTGAPGASMEAVITAVSQDHAIALKLLKLANSAALNTGEPVDSVKKAVLRMGLEKVRQAVLNIGVVDRFSNAVFTERFNFANFWEHSIACGLIAAELAKAVGCMDPDNAFAMGLLHDVGRVALIEQLPDEYARVLEAAQRLDAPLEQVESRLLLVNHADLMGRLLRTWHFPKELVDPITLHHTSASSARGLAPSRLQEVAVLALANRLAHAMLLGSGGNEVVYPMTDFADLLQIDTGTIARIESTIPDETGKIKLSMLAVGSGEGWPMVRDRYRAALERPFRPLFVAPDAPRDAMRIFCAALADDDLGEPPNIAVVHVPDSRAKAEAGNLLRAAEAAAGAQDLPLIVLAPSDAKAVPPIVADRPCEQVRTPVPIARFTAAVNKLAPPE